MVVIICGKLEQLERLRFEISQVKTTQSQSYKF